MGQHPRASVIAACGTGKTLIAARTTARIAPRGRVWRFCRHWTCCPRRSAPGMRQAAKDRQ
ncbi:hypothetical protein [Streptomyces sp. NBC_00009]|uniref:hypothetical protein n=1 Tax=Streptomyces sp. NBC_00009 TaxID=2975620 RepID=UPI0032479A1D